MAILFACMVPHPPMIIPEVGGGSEKQIEKTRAAYEQAMKHIADLAPDTVIISSPHAVMYADYFHISPGKQASGSFSRFGAPQVQFTERYDTELTGLISRLAEKKGFPAGTQGERDARLDHGTMVPLYFLRRYLKDFSLVRTGLSGLSLSEHYTFGEIIRTAVDTLGRRAVFIASGDLSHKLQTYGPYGFAPEGPEYDRKIMDTAGRAAFGELLDYDETFLDKAAECGHRSFVIMAGALNGRAVKATPLSHEDVTGVGYGVCLFEPGQEDDSRCFLKDHEKKQLIRTQAAREKADPYVRLAWHTLESRLLRHRDAEMPEGLPQEMLHTRAGVFVSIHKDGRLRGCIGTISPTASCVAREIMRNAVSAAFHDPRFSPIRPEELDHLEIHVDVLGKAEAIPFEKRREMLDVKRFGVIVSSGSRRGLLLPDLDGVDSIEEQIGIARKKAGIGADEPVELERFEVVRHT